MDGYWWTPIIPQASATKAARIPGLPLLQSYLDDCGMKIE